MSLELGEGHFDGIEVRALRGQKQQPGAACPDGLFGQLAPVAGKIIQNDENSGPEGGCRMGLDVGLEGLSGLSTSARLARSADRPPPSASSTSPPSSG
jgi:hypothetical protein